MCTAISYKTNKHYFGRNLDVEKNYGEAIVITPRRYCFEFKNIPPVDDHYAIIGTAVIADGFPLYFDATNEWGLSVAGLNFPDYTHYCDIKTGMYNVAPYELIPIILGKCKSITEAKHLLKRISITNVPFSKDLPLTPLHWLLSDQVSSIVVEPLESGLSVKENRVGVLTNSPPYDVQCINLSNYAKLSPEGYKAIHLVNHEITPYSRGMGYIGLPGDYSSMSRFVKASFIKSHSISDGSEEENVCQFFHILSSVAMPKGNVITENGDYEITSYSSCCNTDEGVYYYTTYNNPSITAVNMNNEDLNGKSLITYPMFRNAKIFSQN